jgi:adrenodoxin-NADP+ reductase
LLVESSQNLEQMRFCGPLLAKRQVAVVGAGPSGCYVADYILKKSDNVHVDVFERLPVPYGLVRYGVAPDHPEVKNVEQKFTALFESGKATLLTNVGIGRDVVMAELQEHYDGVVIATGVDTDNRLHIPGSNMGNIFSARDLVSYYNTVPSPYGTPLQSPVDLSTCRHAVIIGNGNVALDVARVLSASYKHWCPTDMNCRAVRDLMNSSVKKVTVVGRRGHEHAAFTLAELRELSKMRDSGVVVKIDPFDLPTVLSRSDGSRARSRMLKFMHEIASDQGGELPEGARVVDFKFNLTPVRFLGQEARPEKVGGAVFELRRPNEESVQMAVKADVFFTSIGYRSSAVKGVPFDEEKGLILNDQGRVLKHEGGAVVPGLYCCGWIKRGPKGVILHAMMDAQETASCVVADLAAMPERQTAGKFGLMDGFAARSVVPMSMHSVTKIWETEKRLGVEMGKKAEKMHSVQSMTDIAIGGKVGAVAERKFRGVGEARLPVHQLLAEFVDPDTSAVDATLAQKSAMPLLYQGNKHLDR